MLIIVIFNLFPLPNSFIRLKISWAFIIYFLSFLIYLNYIDTKVMLLLPNWLISITIFNFNFAKIEGNKNMNLNHWNFKLIIIICATPNFKNLLYAFIAFC